MWKWLVGVFVLLLLLCGGGGFFLAATEQGKQLVAQLKPQEKSTEVRIGAVERGDLIKVVSAPGLVDPKTRVQISAQVAARILALPFDEGDNVKKDDVIVRLDAVNLAAALASAKAGMKGEEARLDGARAALVQAEADLGRMRELYASKDVSKAELDNSEAAYLRASSNVKSSEFSVEIAKSNIDRAQKDLENTVIKAPIDGTITVRNAEVGELVLVGTLNNAASVILELADLSTMLVRTKVDEANVAPVQKGQLARIAINAFPDRVFEGKVELVGLKKELDRDGTGYFETEVLVKQTEGDLLRSGLTANVEIEVRTFAEVLKVPSQAVVDRRVDELPKAVFEGSALVDKNKVFARVVYRYIDGKAVATPVSIGSSDVTHTVIVAGLNEGDKIITGPYKVLVTLKDNQRVVEEGTVKKDGKPAGAVAQQADGNGKS